MRIRRRATIGVAVIGLAFPLLPLWAQCPDGSQPPCSAPRPPSPPGPPLVAVLRFANLTADTSEAYLAAGLNEELIRLLATTPGLRTASHFQTRRFGTGANHDPAVIARSVDATFLLTGSVQRIGATMRIGVELTRAPTFGIVWTDRFDRPADDLGAILDDVAARVAREAVGRVQPRRQSASRETAIPPEALRRFLRGTFLTDARGESVVLAITEFTNAIAVAPAFGRAWARRAYAYALLLDNGRTYESLSPDSILARGLASLAQARRLAPNESDTWMADAYLRKHQYPRTFTGVVESFTRAIAIDPANAEAHHQFGSVLAILDRDSAALAEYHRAIELDPGRAVSMWELGRQHHTHGRLLEAIAWYDSSMKLDPTGDPAYFRMRAFITLRDTAGTRRAYDVLQGLVNSRGLSINPATRAVYLAGIGDTVEARRVALSVARARNGVVALAVLGMREDALRIISQRTTRNLVTLRGLRFPEFDALRSDPRYVRFERDARGLP